MSVIFGSNSYSLKTITKQDLGDFAASQSDAHVQYRQKYFHLFFIPFFPIGRFWAVRQEGKLYHPTDELSDFLQTASTKNKHAVWAWTGPLLIIAGFLLFNLIQSIEKSETEKRQKLQTSMLTAFFSNRSKIQPLAKKLNAIYTLTDSALRKDAFEKKQIDTTADGILKLSTAAALTRTDSLTGYNINNTLLVSRFRGEDEALKIVSPDCADALKNGIWSGGYPDTSSAFSEVRKLEDYKYILVLKEYNRADPVVKGNNFASGYSLVNATLIDIETGKEKKTFKLIAGNSNSVQTMSVSTSSDRSRQGRQWLEYDLISNARKEAYQYVFGEADTPQ